MSKKHPVEDKDSWSLHLERVGETVESEEPMIHRRQLRHHHKHDREAELEMKKEREFREKMVRAKKEEEEAVKALKKKHEKRVQELWANPGIEKETTHGMMVRKEIRCHWW